MSVTSTYSFLDLAGALAHPLAGSYVFTGEGSGEVTITMTTEKTAQDVASDGSVMVSKIAGNNGKITISAQQTSNLHKWLLGLYNLVLYSPTSAWAQMAATLRNVSDGTSHVATGMSFSKVPDKMYQAQGQRVSWILDCADIQNLPA